MAALQMRRCIAFSVVVVFIVQTHTLEEDEGPCILSPQQCGMKDDDFHVIFNTCQGSKQHLIFQSLVTLIHLWKQVIFSYIFLAIGCN
ncbi:hypothetical protein MPTK1_4g18040 [Marchantia polymorpha subsp. ruderalis]|uniref:Secreted protein n=2 Tax=Marchantia polymorpha TaxID=3197 RepID=A0AAF6BB44_MARPO|nr:hypothetical protein MARPO_0041s0085 [Marchantia polymorpha]BBN09228.1 hypothetical protein Mp_4g18040 [Marchantia polymorpha subsp. ruderalis]|eukprot:PTQ40216.1 hypothetical protein MARPO_0041s0085 [Marchantia polymorpha]